MGGACKVEMMRKRARAQRRGDVYLRFRFNREGSGNEVSFAHFIIKASMLVIRS
jgi:hypothetical protein